MVEVDVQVVVVLVVVVVVVAGVEVVVLVLSSPANTPICYSLDFAQGLRLLVRTI